MIADTIAYDHKPALKSPILIVAFAGWNDAGAAATTAVRYLTEQLMAAKFASIDPEEFYDFSVQRPQVRLAEGAEREILWPTCDFYSGTGVGVERDFVFGVGAEPHLHWRLFCNALLELARECGIELIVTLGAYLDEVLYTRPVPVTGFATDQRLIRELDLVPSRYQGPTGIVGALGDACRKTGIPHMSLWAALPHYLSTSPNPRGSLALVLRLAQWLGLRVDTTSLERAAAEFQNKVSELVNKDPNLSAFLRDLKKREFEQ